MQFGEIPPQFGGGRWDGLRQFMGGYERQFPAPAQAYEEYFKAYSMTQFRQRERQDVSYGGKIIMPPSALATITELELESPWTFTLRSTGSGQHKTTHGGVVEFIAEEGIVYLPAWMMRMLELSDGDPIHIQGTRLPKGKFVKLQPQTVDFLEISDPKAVLEQALRNYPTLTPGDIIEISYNCLTFEILIMDVVPDAEGISIIETDLEVDFAPPKGYVEPTPKARDTGASMASRLHIDTSQVETYGASGSHSESSATPFQGLGETLSGKKTKGKKNKPITPHDSSSRVRRTEYVLHYLPSRPTIIHSDTMLDEKKVPAALTLPFGQLFFGYKVEKLDVPVHDAENSQENQDTTKEATSTPSVFQGAGHSLASRPQPEVIEIDDD
ncbi:ubiquitin fusion degradation protein [Malassezia yamatoensis]|uniref:Ubiquitin fusion degradation protein n=1 Tax=Malassezia yamatoensis TaxID=253288 RepID=A0AAJ5YTL2_9BASI|nr:ubiquitin fusion degradation protein [Malassezia yamatoensis]